MDTYPNYSKRPTKIIINLQNLDHNLAELRKRLVGTKIMAVVKANAYGHGLIQCAGRLEANGVDYLGVALLEEGELLRQAGIKSPIHVFGGILGSQVERFITSNLEVTASSQSKLLAIEAAAKKLGLSAKVHIKVDTGMGRIGVRPESASKLIESSQNLKHTEIKGVFSHFACADERDLSFTQKQFEKFCPILEQAKNLLGNDILGHISNSAAICQFPQASLDMVRAGLSLFGVNSVEHLEGILDIKPVMSIESKVVYFKVVKAGDSVSYGRTWTAKKDTRVVTIPIGYGDGYLRALSNKAAVLIRGQSYPIVGQICMDQMMVVIGDSEAFNGDKVTLIGSDAKESIRVDKLASLAGTVPHEILSNFNLRMAREFVG